MVKNILFYVLLVNALLLGVGCQPKCDEWYEDNGNGCIEGRQKFLGTYTGTVCPTDGTLFEDMGSYCINASITLSESPNPQRISWDGAIVMWEQSIPIGWDGAYIELGGSNDVYDNLYIPAQSRNIDGIYTIEGGSGVFAESVIDTLGNSSTALVLNYVVSHGQSIWQLRFTGTK